MSRDEIVHMTREAGWTGLYVTYNEPTGKADWKMVRESLTVPVTIEQIERFHDLATAAERQRHRALEMMAACMDMVRQDLISAGIIDAGVAPMMVPEAVAAAMRKAVAAEREACAKVCDERSDSAAVFAMHREVDEAVKCAADIRARCAP